MSVYTIYVDASDEHNYSAKPMDGDFKQVYPVGIDFHPVAKAARMDDGTLVYQAFRNQGMKVDATHLPTKVKIGGPKRSLTDFLLSNSVLLASPDFMAVVEGLEPNQHQFVPVQLVWEDGSHAADFFWFYPGARIDGMDRENTTHEFNEQSGLWQNTSNGKFEVNLDQVGNHVLWIDPRLAAFDLPFVSETFREAASKANLRGIGYHELPVR
jgi:hypothetical protein